MEKFVLRVWCSGGSTPTANPLDLKDTNNRLELRSEMMKIKTFVYFDLESTGLKSSGRPRITEISLVAVNSGDVGELHMKIQRHLNNKNNQIENLLPRVLNKLTLCVYPMAPVMPDASDITGLDNYNLSDQNRFDANTGHLLNNFLARLPSPVCLVAHNGNAYDFPLLKAEMEKVAIQVGSNILCADSYIGIKSIFQNRKFSEKVDVDQKKMKTVSKIRQDRKSSRKHDPIQKKLLPIQSFALIKLHEHILGCKPIMSHGAEADCLALLRTTSALGSDWLDWVEKNCKLFSDCEKMWGWD